MSSANVNIPVVIMKKLKPCPWCGGKPIISSGAFYRNDSQVGFDLVAECGECGSRPKKKVIATVLFEFSKDGELHITVEDLVEMKDQWNARGGDDNNASSRGFADCLLSAARI